MPVYLCSIGLAGAAAGLAVWVSRRVAVNSPEVRKGLIVLAAVTWCVVYGINARNNMIVVRAANEVQFDTRRTMEAAIRHGLLSDIPAGATLVLEGSDFNNWNTVYFYAQEAGRVYNVLHVKDSQNYEEVLASLAATCVPSAAQTECDVPMDAKLYFLQGRSAGRDFGHAVLAKVDRVFYDEDKLLGLLASRAEIFVRMPLAILEPSSVGVAGVEAGAGGARITHGSPSRITRILCPS